MATTKTDDLLAQVKALAAQTSQETHARKIETKYSRQARVQSDLRKGWRFAYQLWVGFMWMRKWFIRPAVHALIEVVKFIIHWYRWLWSWVVYKRTEDNVLILSKTRAGLMFCATVFFCGWMAFNTAEMVWDAGIYTFTVRHDEELYLFGSQEIDPITNMHNIEGADKLPWTPEDSMYFRAQGGWFADLWTIFHGKGFLYWPENVGAAVPYGYNWCHVTYYGWRLRMWGVKNSYMRILYLSCVPLSQKPVEPGQYAPPAPPPPAPRPPENPAMLDEPPALIQSLIARNVSG
jgi:hypothetical protein